MQKNALDLFWEQITHRAAVLFSPNMRALLEQGKHEPFIGALLAAPNETVLAELLVTELSKEPSQAKLIDKYLKRIRIVRVPLSAFNFGAGTIAKEELGQAASAFHEFLESYFNEQEEGEIIMLSLAEKDERQ